MVHLDLLMHVCPKKENRRDVYRGFLERNQTHILLCRLHFLCVCLLLIQLKQGSSLKVTAPDL